MAGRRTRGGSSSDGATRAAAIAELLHLECGHLLELYRKREYLGADPQVLPDPMLVSVPPASAQLEVRDQLWRIHSALSQCCCLLDRAIAREERELGLAVAAGGERDDYQKQRKTVKDRLKLLLVSTQLLLAPGGTAAPIPTDCGEPDKAAVLFDVKMWIYRIFLELDYWSLTAVGTLQALPAGGTTRTSARRKRNARR
ncbi:hypothetical protein CRUP_025709 [Coryphaenoides rupestris]|nr:hypothetical protein CRUP_025709 [Coryphaenoides rupestris]